MTGGATCHWGNPGRRSAPIDPKSEDLLALAAAAAWSFANPAYGFQAWKDLVTNARSLRTRSDMCPGVLRPWHAEDGLLIRLRLVGGHLSGEQLAALFDVAERFGDGDVHLTARANLQIRGFAAADALPEEVVTVIEVIGLLPSRSHELIRNILVSPQTGFSGGRADLRPIAEELDQLLLADDRLGALPGRFLFVLDDGRGDLLGRPCDLGLVALDGARAQLRIGDGWGPVVDLAESAGHLAALARAFLDSRHEGPTAPWHVRELDEPLAAHVDLRPEAPIASDALAYGRVDGGIHHEIPGGILNRFAAKVFLDEPVLIVTPWRGIFIPNSTEQQ